MMMPLMFAFFSMSVPSGLALYWVASNIISVVTKFFITGWGGLLPLKEKLTRQIGQLFKGKGSLRERLGMQAGTSALPASIRYRQETIVAENENVPEKQAENAGKELDLDNKEKIKTKTKKSKKGKRR
jgi:membrane protein insertase Oxa1/YidC/SpoIIIJ